MKLNEILSVSGVPGLHKYVAQGSQGIIIESLTDNKRVMLNASSKASTLSDIAIFTDDNEVPLADIFTKIAKEHNNKVLSLNKKSSTKEVTDFFISILPNYDKERVHLSDIKKLISWYNLLISCGITEFSIEDDVEQDDSSVSSNADASSSDEPVVKKVIAKTTKSPLQKAMAKTGASKSNIKSSATKVKSTKSNNIRKSQ